MDEFDRLKRALKELRRLEERGQPRADWKDPEDKKRYIREYKRKLRAEKLPSPRVCPRCGQVKPRSKQWVVQRGKPLCRSCAMKDWFP